MKELPHCVACGQIIYPKGLRCAACLEPIGKRDSWHHDAHSRAVHKDCDQPLGVPNLKINQEKP